MTDIKGGLAQDITRVAKGAGIIFSGIVFWAAASFFFSLFAARVLGPADFGLYSLGLAVFNVLSILSLCGLDNGLVRFVALFRGESDTPRVKGTILFALFSVTSVSLGIGLLLFLLAGPLSQQVFHKEGLAAVLRWFALGLPLFGAASMFWAALQGFQNMKYLAGTKNILEPAVRLITVSLFFLAGLRLRAVLWSHLLAWGIALGAAGYLLVRIFPRLKKPGRPVIEARRIVSFSLPLLMVGFLSIGINRTDRLLLGYFRDSRDVGVYSAAFQTAMLLMMILQSFNTIFAPMISDLFNRAERTKLAALFQSVTRWVLTAALPLFVVLALFPEEILALFGDPFRSGARCLVILAIAQLVNCLTGPVGYMLIMSGHPRMEFFNNLAIFVLEFVLALILIPLLGIEGAAVAAAVSLSLVNGLRLLEVFRVLKMHPYSVRFLKPAGATLVALGALVVLKAVWPAASHPGVSMIVTVALSFGLYGLTLFLLGLNPEDKYILLQIKQRFGGKVENAQG